MGVETILNLNAVTVTTSQGLLLHLIFMMSHFSFLSSFLNDTFIIFIFLASSIGKQLNFFSFF